MAQTARARSPLRTEPQDAVLVTAALGGERWAQEALFRRHIGVALGLAQRILGHPTEADDIVQDAFVEAFGKLERLDNPQAFAAWLRTIVIRRIGKHLRRQQLLVRLGLRTATPVDPDALISPDAPAEIKTELRALRSMLARLPVEERVSLVLRRVEGLELAEIAEEMGLSLATVKRRLSAAEARLARAQEGK